MSVVPHTERIPEFIELTHAYLLILAANKDTFYSEGAHNVLEKFAKVLHGKNSVLILDAKDLRTVPNLALALPTVLNRLVVHATQSHTIQMIVLNSNDQCPVTATARLLSNVMHNPICIWDEDGKVSAGGTNYLADSHRKVLGMVYKEYADGSEFTTADIANLFPVENGKTNTSHASAIGNALKTVSTKYPNLLTFTSRMVRNDDPKKRNQLTFFYRIPNGVPMVGTVDADEKLETS